METRVMNSDASTQHPHSEPNPDSNPDMNRKSSFSGDEGSAVRDFNTFFEKLSSLDDLSWGTDEQAKAPARKAGRKKAARSVKAAAAGRAAPDSARAKPGMRVLNSTTAFAPTAAAKAISEAGEVDDGDRSWKPAPRITLADVAVAMRMLIIGLILFALGLGAGWAALSLPNRFDRQVANPARNGAREGGGTALHGGFKKALGRLKTELEATLGFGNGSRDNSRDASPMAGPTPDTEASAPRQTIARGNTGQTPAAKFDRRSPEQEAAKHVSVFRRSEPISLPVITNEEVKAAQVGNGSSTAPGSAGFTSPLGGTVERRFALQVGACGSARCVESYRSLLTGQVDANAIKVVPHPATETGAAIQRIRIEPLTRAEAERLKQDLASNDSRFQGAYLITLR